jgi:hypothetical protein
MEESIFSLSLSLSLSLALALSLSLSLSLYLSISLALSLSLAAKPLLHMTTPTRTTPVGLLYLLALLFIGWLT